MEVQVKILTCFRTGLKKPKKRNKTSQKPRPLKVVLSSVQERMEVTKEVIRRKEASEPTTCQVSGDFSREERSEYKKLRQEMERREKTGEKNLVIKRGKIIKKG